MTDKQTITKGVSISEESTVPVLAWIAKKWWRFKHIISSVRVRGGVVATFRKAYVLFRQQGLEGIKQSLFFTLSGRNDYSRWIHRYDTMTDESRDVYRKRIVVMEKKPLISVVMPTYNPNPEWLKKAIESVQKQLYPNWELCIADDASTVPEIRQILEQFIKDDPRIKVVFREENGHISAASNSAISIVSGDWVALMDHDDLLPEYALFWVADAINKHSNIRLIYSDEDKIDERDNRHSPYFKCDWNIDLFYSHNMFSHLGVYDTALLKEVDGFRLGYEGSQDYDLALRCIEKVDVKQIYHIPRVLYHWRVHAESTAKSGDAKPYAMTAGERSLRDHVKRQGMNAEVELIKFGYRVKFSLPDKLPLVSLIIPTRNSLSLIQQCVQSIIDKTTYQNYEILIVDNGSDKQEVLDYFDTLAQKSKINIYRDNRPFNYSQLMNAAVKMANGEIIGLLNNDVEVITPDWLTEMVSHAIRKDIGAVGAKLWYPNDTLQHGGVILGMGEHGCAGHGHYKFYKSDHGYFGRMSLISEYSAVSAACLVIEKSIYNEVGGFNEEDLQVAFNDVDFCLKVKKAGYRNIWTPYAELYHYESASRGDDISAEKQARIATEVEYMQVRWGDLLENDPAYSPNLNLDYSDFSYAWPPRVELINGDLAQ